MRERRYEGGARQRLAAACEAIAEAGRLLAAGQAEYARDVLWEAEHLLSVRAHEELIAYAVHRVPARRIGIPRWLRTLVIEQSSGLCAICGLSLGEAVPHIDHIIPVHRGGRTEPDNLRATHRACNVTRRYEEWAEVDEYMARPEVA